MTANYQKKFYKDYEKLQNKYDKLSLRYKILKDNERRLLKIEETAMATKMKLLRELDEQKEEIKSLTDEVAKLKKEIERLNAKENIDGTTSGIPTSMTAIGKKKIIPNSRKNTGEKIGRKEGHKKDKLKKIPDDKIDNHISHELKACPHCQEHKLEKTGKIISKDVKDYKIIVENTRHDYIEYKCSCCGKIVHEEIPNHLKEEMSIWRRSKKFNINFNKCRKCSI